MNKDITKELNNIPFNRLSNEQYKTIMELDDDDKLILNTVMKYESIDQLFYLLEDINRLEFHEMVGIESVMEDYNEVEEGTYRIR